MQAMAKITSKGQITIPKAVRDALGLKTGGWVIFRVTEEQLADMLPVPDFLDLAGSMPPPPDKRGASWEEIRREVSRARAREWAAKEQRSR